MRILTSIFLLSCVVVTLSGPVHEESKRLIKTSEDDPGKWLNENEILSLIESKQTFIDITDHQDYPPVKSESAKRFPSTRRFKDAVEDLIKDIDQSRVEDFVREFSSFHNRYFQSDTGVESQKWLLQQVQESLKGYPGTGSVKEFEHPDWAQNSVIARLEGKDSSLKSAPLILGAHLDSLNLGGSSLKAPGADDNASGSVVVLETLRIFASRGIIPTRTIEFHWYAAEEPGLRGSNAIAQSYKNTGVNVFAMLNFDVVGYQAPGINDVGIYTDNVDMELTIFLKGLVDSYLVYGRRDRTCGYGCSDHASFHNYGFPAAFTAEYVFHPHMHTVNDSFENVGFTQVLEFVKLAIGFTVELAEPTN